MTDNIERLKKFCDGATPGEWKLTRYTNYIGYSIYAGDRGCISERWYETEQKEPYASEMQNNGELISASRTALPELIALVEKMEAALKALDDDWTEIFDNPENKPYQSVIDKKTKEIWDGARQSLQAVEDYRRKE